MAGLLRTISKAKWYADWVGERELPSDALTDLRTSQNALSVWTVDESPVTLRTVVVALAADRQNLSKLDYALIEEGVVNALGVRLSRSDGETPHDAANKSLHRDLTELTVGKVAELAMSMRPTDDRPHVRISEKKIREMLVEALRSGALDRTRMHPTLLRDLEPQHADDWLIGHA